MPLAWFCARFCCSFPAAFISGIGGTVFRSCKSRFGRVDGCFRPSQALTLSRRWAKNPVRAKHQPAAPPLLVDHWVGRCLVVLAAVLGVAFSGFNVRLGRTSAMAGSWGRSLRFSTKLNDHAVRGLVVLTMGLFVSAPTGFMQQQDQGRLIVNIQL